MNKRIGLFTLVIGIIFIVGLNGCKSSKKATEVQVEPTIALLTDYGTADVFVAEMKGAILTINPKVNIIDLTHEIESFNVTQAAYLLNQASHEFPAGVIFVAVVDPGVGTSRVPIMVLTKAAKYYVAPDNGLLTLVLEREGFAKGWKLDRPGYYKQGGISATDHGRDIFGPVAANLSTGISPDTIGSTLLQKDVFLLPYRPAAVNGQYLTGEVWHVDHYGNVVTNIPASIAPDLKEGTQLRITVNKQIFTAPLVKTFGDVQKDRLAILVGSQGFLEFCVNQGSAGKMLNVKPGSPVLIQR